MLLIFGYLRDVESICLGLACKKFYKIHRSLHGSVELWLTSWNTPSMQIGGRLIFSDLGDLLNDWAGPNLAYKYPHTKYAFTTPEKLEVMMVQLELDLDEENCEAWMTKQTFHERVSKSDNALSELWGFAGSMGSTDDDTVYDEHLSDDRSYPSITTDQSENHKGEAGEIEQEIEEEIAEQGFRWVKWIGYEGNPMDTSDEEDI